MEKLRESWSIGATEFSSRCSKLDESIVNTKYADVKKLSESCDSNALIKIGQKLKESLTDDNEIQILNKILESLVANGADNTFKLWRLPVARYDWKNHNGRIYPKQLWENIQTNQRDAWCGLCGLADHPIADDDPGLFRDQAVVWHDMEVGDDGYVYGVASFVGPYGHLAQEILEHGGRVGTSSSGFGDVNKITKIVDPNTYIVERLADLVLNPSQGTYGQSSDTHVSPQDFTADLSKAAVIDFTGNKPVKESTVQQAQPQATPTQTQNQPRSKILMKANAAAPADNGAQNVNNTTAQEPVNRLTKVEEKAFRQYVDKFLQEAGKIDNPLKRLNECVDILACFEEGNCQDLRESVEKQIVEEKAKLEALVESSTKLSKDYDMTASEFREAAERNTKKAILLNEQVIDLNALLEESTARNVELKNEIQKLNEQIANQAKITDTKVKTVNKNVVESLKENDQLREQYAEMKKKNRNLMERISQLSLTNSKFEKENGVLETKLAEAARLIQRGKRITESSNDDIDSLKRYAKTQSEQIAKFSSENASLKEAYDAQCKKFDELEKKYETLKEAYEDLQNPMRHQAPSATDRIGKYFDLRENGGLEIDEYWQDLRENYGEKVLPFESEIRGAKTLREATSRFMKHRNEIFKEFEGTSAIEDYKFRNKEERSKIYESTGMLNPEESYKNASKEEKDKEFLSHLYSQGLM